ncbi:MAG: adenine phosphoribosyltransferase [Clostridia bacterium]|nr:adenine phosphoribosyltransferase [Clostridia bacterium]
MKDSYTITIAGLKRSLPLCPISEELKIGAFVIFGDPELTVACAKALNEKCPEHDIMITAESKGIPLIYEMARQQGNRRYLLARKAPKLYMRNPRSVAVRSITTDHQQMLYLDGQDAEYMKGRRVVIVDDVISTGESLRALEQLVEKAGGQIVARMAILAEGDATQRDDLIYLEKLPLFDKNGDPINA